MQDTQHSWESDPEMVTRARPVQRMAAKAREGPKAKVDAPQEVPPVPLTPEQSAAALFLLHEAAFGGQPAGGRRYRMSHPSLRDLFARPVLGACFLDEVAMHLALKELDLVRM